MRIIVFKIALDAIPCCLKIVAVTAVRTDLEKARNHVVSSVSIG